MSKNPELEALEAKDPDDLGTCSDDTDQDTPEEPIEFTEGGDDE